MTCRIRTEEPSGARSSTSQALRLGTIFSASGQLLTIAQITSRAAWIRIVASAEILGPAPSTFTIGAAWPRPIPGASTARAKDRSRRAGRMGHFDANQRQRFDIYTLTGP